MNSSFFNKLISQIASKLKMMEELGISITPSFIDETLNKIVQEFKSIPDFQCSEEDFKLLKFQLESMFNIKIGERTIKLANPDLPLWFNNKKSQIDWPHWNAYKEMLISQARAIEVINENEKVIDAILDYSGNPKTPGTWSRKGLVMGNVQSGKTQNFLGLINKAIDCGYKTIIVLGGHLNDLRKQTQERIDEGVLGKESKHLILENKATAAPIGVGVFNPNKIHTGTSTMGDFNKASADNFGFKLNGSDPVIFTIKKHTGVLEGLYKFIKEEHFLNPETGKRLDGPLLLIDDEADYASINTKHHKEEVTKTNDCIRNLLTLFNRNTYVGYTATPFANIFIDPDNNSYTEEDDLFPRDFMIKIPVPDDYMGQDFFFGDGLPQELEEDDVDTATEKFSPVILINDHSPIFELKKAQDIPYLPESLKEAVRAFIIVIAIRCLRGESSAHNTMLVNISHLKDHQNQLEFSIGEYHKKINQAIISYAGLDISNARSSTRLAELETTFNKVFNVKESYIDIFKRLQEASGKIETWAINQSNKKADNKDLDYSKHKEYGLSVIVIGGHKLSRGLTLEGLSISYFARNSKAYDTLMQMCRWFGYRPTYKDLCKVYLPVESYDWYSFISSSIKEIYHELDLMSKRGDRPSEFGLKVREHPGAMIITAKNKIGAGTSEVIRQDLWGQIQRRFKFKEDNDLNIKNLAYASKFIQKLTDSGKRDNKLSHEGGAFVFSDVSYEDIINFIQNIDLPEDDIGNRAVISHLKSMKNKGLKNPKVALFNQNKSRNPKWVELLESSDEKFINTSYSFAGENITLPKRAMNFRDGNYYIPSVQLGNPDDEKLFLENPTLVSNSMKTKAVNFDYLCADERDFPGLIIYLFAVAHITPFPYNKKNNPDPKIKLAHGKNATLGFSLSFPRIDKLKGLTNKEIIALNKTTKHEYKVNKIQSKLREIADYDDYDDE